MNRCIYWCLRGLGYLLFMLCALAWIAATGSGLYLLFQLIVYLFGYLLSNAVALIAYALFGYILFLIGRFFVTKSLGFQSG